MAHEHDHGQDAPSDLTLRVKALESLLVEKGLVDPAALDAIVDTYENKIGPRNGARVVARAWVDPAYKKRLLARWRSGNRGTRVFRRAGRAHGRRREHSEAAQPGRLHVMLLLPVAGARAAAGLVQVGAVPFASRNRSARCSARVWNGAGRRSRDTGVGQHGRDPLSRAAGTAGRYREMTEEELAALVTRDSMVGVASGGASRRQAMNGIHDMGGMHGMGPIRHEENEPVFHEKWEGRVYAINRAIGAWRKWNIDAGRHAIEQLPPADYLRMSYYEKWLVRNIGLLVKHGLVTQEEIDTGKPAPGSRKATPPFTVANLALTDCATAELRSSGRGCQSALQSGRPRSRAQDQPHGPHAPAALREGPGRGRRPASRDLRVPGHERTFPGRAAAAPLLRAVPGAGVVGRERFAQGFCLP